METTPPRAAPDAAVLDYLGRYGDAAIGLDPIGLDPAGLDPAGSEIDAAATGAATAPDRKRDEH